MGEASQTLSIGRIARRATLSAVALAASFGSTAWAVDATTTADSGPGSLRQAVADTPAGGTVVIQPLPGPILLATQIQIDKDLTIAGQGAVGTIIDGFDGTRVFLAAAAGFPHPTVTIRDLTIRNGHAGAGQDGGGIRALGTLTLERVVMTGNAAGSANSGGLPGGTGGAVYAGGVLTVTDSVLSGNAAGGGAYAAGTPGAGGNGGAIALAGPADVIRTTISGNSAGPGGGSMSGSGGAGGNGGGIACNGCDGLSLFESTVSGNAAGDAGPGSGFSGAPGGTGGGVYGALTIRNSTLSGNSAGSASGIFPDAAGGGASGSGSITSSTITGNTVGPNGGLTDPPSGSGIFAAGPLRVLNSIVDGNPGVDCAEGAPSSIDDVGHNFGSDPGCPAGFADANPLLDPAGLAANGGPTATIRLLAGSPAIDFVPVAACTQHPSVTTALTIDQRGSSRPTGPACDSGAFEVQPISPLPARKKKCKKHRKKKRHRAGASKKHKKKCKKKKKKK